MTKYLTPVLLAAVIAAAVWTGRSHGADKKSVVKITAYINQTSGCQKHTEDFLRNLARKYGDRVKLEFVNFGEPAGRRRWLGDGCHCMTIRLNGTEQVTVWEKGVPVSVRFVMPAGYMWSHHELAAAVRQILEGVRDEDRTPPPVTAVKQNGAWSLRIGDTVVLTLNDEKRIRHAADILAAAARRKPLVQEDFSLRPGRSAIMLQVRGQTFLEVTEADASAAKATLESLASLWLKKVRREFPATTRPFPDARRPLKQRLQQQLR